MKFLVDAQLPPRLCQWLADRGHDAIHVTVREGMLTDSSVAQWAIDEGRVIISKDEDFLALRSSGQFVLLWLRCGNVTNRALASWLEARWERVARLLAEGEVLIELA